MVLAGKEFAYCSRILSIKFQIVMISYLFFSRVKEYRRCVQVLAFEFLVPSISGIYMESACLCAYLRNA